jgi:hypothetical protein
METRSSLNGRTILSYPKGHTPSSCRLILPQRTGSVTWSVRISTRRSVSALVHFDQYPHQRHGHTLIGYVRTAGHSTRGDNGDGLVRSARSQLRRISGPSIFGTAITVGNTGGTYRESKIEWNRGRSSAKEPCE